MKKVQHRGMFKHGVMGGVVTSTLCGRVRNEQDYNVADTDAEVTCQFCRSIMSNAKTYAHRTRFECTPEYLATH